MPRRRSASKSSPDAAPQASAPRPRREAAHGLGNLDVQRSLKDAASKSSRNTGTPLSESVAGPIQARLGGDLDDVRVHTDACAERAASSLDARAFTVGRDIFFAPGEYRPGTNDGDRLLTHELTHVVQQRNTPIDVRSIEPQGSAAEREAQATAGDVIAGRAPKPPSETPRAIPRDVGWASRGEIPDAYGMGYNTIYKNAGPESKGAVLALASLETPRMFVDIEKYKQLEAPVRKSILALGPHAGDTACAGWFDILLANDPDFKPQLTPEQIRAGEAAYYGSMRESVLERRVESAKAELPTLSRTEIEAKWEDNKYGFITVAQTPKHGLKADTLFGVWLKYWSDRHKVAQALEREIAKRAGDDGTWVRKINEYEDGQRDALGPDYNKARRDIALANLMFRHSVHAMELCRTADARGRSLTLDELTEMVISFAEVWDPMVQGLEMGLTFGRGGSPGSLRTRPAKTEPAKTEPVKTEPVKTEPVKTEPVKTEPVKTEPVKTEPVKTEPVVAKKPDVKKQPERRKEPEVQKEPEVKKEPEAKKAEEPAAKTATRPTADDATRRMGQLRDESQRLSDAAKADEPAVRQAQSRYKTARTKADDLGSEVTGYKALTPEAVQKNPALKDQYAKAQKARKNLRQADKDLKSAEAEYRTLKAQQDARYEQIRKNNLEAEKLSRPELDLPPTQRGTVNEARVLKEEGLVGIKPQLTVRDPKTGEYAVTIPDGVRPGGGTVDVKDVAKLSETQQLRLQREYSRQRGQKAEIITGTKTEVPADMEGNYVIRRRPDLGPR